jgi:hypothetical protein
MAPVRNPSSVPLGVRPVRDTVQVPDKPSAPSDEDFSRLRADRDRLRSERDALREQLSEARAVLRAANLDGSPDTVRDNLRQLRALAGANGSIERATDDARTMREIRRTFYSAFLLPMSGLSPLDLLAITVETPAGPARTLVRVLKTQHAAFTHAIHCETVFAVGEAQSMRLAVPFGEGQFELVRAGRGFETVVGPIMERENLSRLLSAVSFEWAFGEFENDCWLRMHRAVSDRFVGAQAQTSMLERHMR